jgi:hypothetical protein
MGRWPTRAMKILGAVVSPPIVFSKERFVARASRRAASTVVSTFFINALPPYFRRSGQC